MVPNHCQLGDLAAPLHEESRIQAVHPEEPGRAVARGLLAREVPQGVPHV